MAAQCYHIRAMIKIVLPLLALNNSSYSSTYPTGYDKMCSNHLTCKDTKWPTMIKSPRQTLTISHLIDCLRHLTAKSLTFLSGYIQSSNSRAVSWSTGGHDCNNTCICNKNSKHINTSSDNNGNVSLYATSYDFDFENSTAISQKLVDCSLGHILEWAATNGCLRPEHQIYTLINLCNLWQSLTEHNWNNHKNMHQWV